MSVTFTDQKTGGSNIALTFTKIDVTAESENEIQAIPNADPFFVFLGNKGDAIEVTGDIFSSSDYTILQGFTGQTLLKASSSGYPEIVNDTYWAVITRKLSRKGGYLDRWTYNIKLMRVFSGSTTKADGTDL